MRGPDFTRRCSPFAEICRGVPNLRWMPDAEVVPLTGRTCLVGHDGWGDGSRFRHVVVLTHVPPFRVGCRHGGKVSDDNWLPFFTCPAVGDALRDAMAAAPDGRMTALCGHTHGSGEADILPDLRARPAGRRTARRACSR